MNVPRLLASLAAFLVFAVGLAVLSVYFYQKPHVVLYSAQDKDFAEAVLPEFTKRTGLDVTPKYDTEANKSVSLYVELVQEKGRPRCDVFWNNEIVSTLRLQRKGLLEPYECPAEASFPASAHPDDHSWHAFAERARVIVVNKDRVKEQDYPKSILDLTEPKWKGRVVMAKPQAGTTATQAAALFAVLGPEKAKAFYKDLRDNGVQLAEGNKQAAELVGAGTADVGMTDTDDAYEEIKDGHPVAILFPDRDAEPETRMGTLFIPNTLMVMKGCPNPEGARKLVDFLLSPEVEAKLAEFGAHQIPLNPKADAKLPPEIEAGRKAKRMDVDWDKAADCWDEAQTFLRDEFARP
jgi:iron(III) transport system substrate-binding protein